MDQPDEISRRDAVIGISFLGVLMAALSATIVYRIVDSQPRKGPRHSPPIAAASRESVDSPPMFPPIDQAIDTVSHEEPLTLGASARSRLGKSASPTFVAPAGRETVDP
jgi:hypothetical protein